MQLKWRVGHIRGYLELGMLDAASAELDAIAEADRRDPEVQGLRACILQEKKDWPQLEQFSAAMARECPLEVSWWITWAYAARRASSLNAAEVILLQAEQLHPREGIVHFNLGCYACQRGDLSLARSRVDRAIALDEHFRESAATDPDLASLRQAEAAT
jgi:Tfp pilus assembly protein PilF